MSGASRSTGFLAWLLAAVMLPVVAWADDCLVNQPQAEGMPAMHDALSFRGATARACVFVVDGRPSQPDSAQSIVDLGRVFGGSWTHVGRVVSGREFRLGDDLLAPSVRVSFEVDPEQRMPDRLDGTYVLRWDDVSSPTRLDLAVVIDVTGGWTGLVFSTDLFAGSGSMTQSWTVERTDGTRVLPRDPALSLYVRTAIVPCLDCGGRSLPIPSPVWLLVIGAGLFSWGLRYRQSAGRRW
jgi:hypothetical protein